MIYTIQRAELSMPNIQKIKEEFSLEDINDDVLILDFSQVNLMDSEGISWIVDLMNQLEKRKISLKIINVCPSVYKIFKITMLDSILDIKR